MAGSYKNFTISELGDRGGPQKTITPSSLFYEDQVEVRFPLATLRVVLRNQLLIAWRPHPNVDVGWPAAVGDGHVALQAIPSSSASKHRGPVCIVVVPLGLASQNSVLALEIGLQSSAPSTVPENTYPLPTTRTVRLARVTLRRTQPRRWLY